MGPGNRPPGFCCVVGYGNIQRRDDGLGPYVISKLSEVVGQGAGVLLMARDQLDHDLIEDLQDAGEIILVDATIDYLPDGWQRRPLASRLDAPPHLTHALGPEYLLGLIGWLYNTGPAGWLVSIQGEDFGMGRGLSAVAEKRACQAINDLAKFVSKEERVCKPALIS